MFFFFFFAHNIFSDECTHVDQEILKMCTKCNNRNKHRSSLSSESADCYKRTDSKIFHGKFNGNFFTFFLFTFGWTTDEIKESCLWIGSLCVTQLKIDRMKNSAEPYLMYVHWCYRFWSTMLLKENFWGSRGKKNLIDTMQTK